MTHPNYREIAEKEVQWDRLLPERVFLRRPVTSLFYDGGLIDIENFLETLLRWSNSAFAEGNAVLAVGEREDGHLSRVDLFDLSGNSLSRDCGTIRAYWRSLDVDFFSKTCVLFNKGMDWILYEEALEDFGVLALFTEHRAVTDSSEWLAVLDYFFTKFEIESNLAKRPGSEHLNSLRREYLEQLLANY